MRSRIRKRGPILFGGKCSRGKFIAEETEESETIPPRFGSAHAGHVFAPSLLTDPLFYRAILSLGKRETARIFAGKIQDCLSEPGPMRVL
jgi:hypothetical protein